MTEAGTEAIIEGPKLLVHTILIWTFLKAITKISERGSTCRVVSDSV